MSQYTFNKDAMILYLDFELEFEYGEISEFTIEVHNFDEFYSKLNQYYKHDYRLLFPTVPEYASFDGIRFESREGSQRLSVDFGDSFKRATMIFDDNEFAAIKTDQLKRIRNIVME